MSHISDDGIAHLARLAKISVSAEEKKSLRPELEKILTLMDSLQSIDTDGVEPLVSVLQEILPTAQLTLHDDVALDNNQAETLLTLAPAKKMVAVDDTTAGFFVVPKVVAQEG